MEELQSAEQDVKDCQEALELAHKDLGESMDWCFKMRSNLQNALNHLKEIQHD